MIWSSAHVCKGQSGCHHAQLFFKMFVPCISRNPPHMFRKQHRNVHVCLFCHQPVSNISGILLLFLLLRCVSVSHEIRYICGGSCAGVEQWELPFSHGNVHTYSRSYAEIWLPVRLVKTWDFSWCFHSCLFSDMKWGTDFLWSLPLTQSQELSGERWHSRQEVMYKFCCGHHMLSSTPLPYYQNLSNLVVFPSRHLHRCLLRVWLLFLLISSWDMSESS